MAIGYETSPIDEELSGLPYPIYVRPIDYHLGIHRIDYHHHFHPRTDIELGHRPKSAPEYLNDELSLERWLLGSDIDQADKETEVDLFNGKPVDPLMFAGKAVRYCRGQLVPRYLHQYYHDVFAGPELPDTSADKFRTVVAALCQIVPRQAIDVRPNILGQPYRIRQLGDEQHNFIASRKLIHHEKAYSDRRYERLNKRRIIGRFFAQYAAEQEITAADLSPHVIEEFLEAEEEARLRELGNQIMVAVIKETLPEVNKLHKTAKEKGLVVGITTEPFHVVLKFFTRDKFQDYYLPLRESLRGAQGIA